MTREEILAMKPGRELDALVAQKVFNLCVLDRIEGYGDGCVLSDEGWQEWTKHPMCGQMDDPDFVPPYSTDIYAAWEVMEKIKTKDPFQYVGDLHIVWGAYGENLTPKGPHGQMIYPNALCWLVSNETETNAFRVTADNAPEAICKAALLACMEVK